MGQFDRIHVYHVLGNRETSRLVCVCGHTHWPLVVELKPRLAGRSHAVTRLGGGAVTLNHTTNTHVFGGVALVGRPRASLIAVALGRRVNRLHLCLRLPTCASERDVFPDRLPVAAAKHAGHPLCRPIPIERSPSVLSITRDHHILARVKCHIGQITAARRQHCFSVLCHWCTDGDNPAERKPTQIRGRERWTHRLRPRVDVHTRLALIAMRRSRRRCCCCCC
mmetsp:Transcript_35421/g.101773  ORF Transcript_35421/g.101773 Transcript_35421/m.101773 type:complete len:223 (+) Transcript_35421:2062-2730(+)